MSYKFEMVMADGKTRRLEVHDVIFPSIIQPSETLVENDGVDRMPEKFRQSFREIFGEERCDESTRGQRPVGGRGDAEEGSR